MELLELFKRQLASTSGSSSKNTIKNYVSDVRHFISWFEAVTASKFEASSITPDVILLYQNSMGGLLLDGQLQSNSQLSAASMKRHLSSIRKFFTVLEGENILRENPFKKIVTQESVEPTDYWHLKSFRDYLMMGNASKITVKNYLSDISGFARWYEEAILPTVENPVSSNQGFYLITQAIVEDYRKRLVEIQNAAPRTINRKLSALRRYLEFATRKGFITNQEININSVEAEIAEEVESLPKVPLSEIKAQLTSPTRTYSKIPPVRLVQKLLVNPYLILEEGAANAITAFLIGKKVTGIANLPQKLSAQIVAKNALRVQNQGLSTLLGVRNIEKEFYAPEKVSLSGFPIHQKMFHHVRFTRPNWYKRYHNYAFVHYIHFALLVIFASGVGVALYQNLVVQKQTPTFAAATAPPRILSFQGRLTDALDNPITSPQPVRFMIYNSLAATGAAELWEETRTISPDQDGIFSVLLGSDSTGANASSCGSFPPGSPYNTACLIPSTVFSDNSQIWLGVTIANSTELAPRQKIATVGYATNSEFLQGLPPTSAVSSFVNAVLALDSTGSFNLNDGIEHTFQVSNGTLTLKAQTLNLTTSLGTNGNIILNPEGSGKVDIQKPIINNSNTGNLVRGGVEINDKFGVLATESAVAAFVVNNNTTGGDIFAASSSGTTRFVIGNDGTLTSSIYAGQNAVLYGTQTTGVIGQVTTASTGLCLQSGASLPTWGTCGTSYWNLTTDNGALTPFSSTLDLLIGGQSTASAKFAFINNASGSPTASISGNLSIAVPTGANGANLFNIFNGGSLNFQTSGGGNAGLTSRLFIANDGRIGIGTTSPFIRNALDIRGLSGTSSTASISATSSYASLVVDNAGRGDLIAASASGVPNFVVKNNGDIIVGPGGGGKITAAIIDPYLVQNQKTSGIQSLTFQTLGASNADFIFQNTSTTLSTLTMAGQFQLPITGSTGGIVLGGDTQLFRGAADRIDIAANDSLNFLSGSGGLLTNGTTRIDASGNGTFANINITGTCTGCISTGNSPFYLSQGAIVPGNTTLDFLLGGVATTSAKFAVLNIAGGTPTASVSAQNVAGQALVLGSDGTIQSTRNNNLTIGGSTTGSIILSPSNGSGAVGINTSTSLSALEVKGRTGTGTVVVNNLPAATTYGAIGFSSPLDGNNYALAGVSGGEVILNSPANNPLSLRQGNQVYAIINSTTGYFGIGEAFASPLATLHVNGGNKGGRAAAIFDQVGASTNDILSASASGVTKFVIKNDGTASSSAGFTVDGIGSIQSTRNQTLTVGGGSTGNLVLGRTSQTVSLPGFTTNGGILYTNASGVLSQTGTGTATQCLLGGAGTPAFGSCATGVNASPFYEIASQGIIVQGNTTEDFLLGSTATTSAKFAVLNIAGGTPTASVSSGLSGTAAYIDALGNFATKNKMPLTLGGGGTGNISVQGNGTLTLVDPTINLSGTTPTFQTLSNNNLTISAGSGTINLNTVSNGNVTAGTGTFTIGSGGTGTLAMNGSAITTTTALVGLFDANATTINFGRAGTNNINLGGTSGALNVGNGGSYTIQTTSNGQLNVSAGSGLLTLNTLSNGAVTTGNGLTTLGGNLTVNGTTISLAGTSPTISTTGSNSLTITTAGSGNLTLSSDSDSSIFVGNATTPAPLSISGGIGNNAALVLNQLNSTGNLLSASASGVSKFVIKNDGTASSSAGFTVDGIGNIQSTNNQTLTIGGGSTGNLILGKASQTLTLPGFTTNGGLFYTNASGVLAQTGTGGATQCLLGGAGTPTFGSCATGVNTSPFYEIASQGIIVQGNTTEDFILGGTATTSAKFAVLNINGNGPATATVSGNLIVMPRDGAGGFLGIGTTSPISPLTAKSRNDVASLGSEQVTNGTFTGNATGWTLGTGWSYNSNNVIHSGANGVLEQNVSAVAGATYLVTYTVSGWTTGSFYVSIGGTDGYTVQRNGTGLSQVITTINTANLKFTTLGSFDGVLDDISVVKVTGSESIASFLNTDNTIGLEIRSGGTGTLNTFVGTGAGFSEMVSGENSFFGYAAGFSNQTGNANSFYGSNAGYSNTAGSNSFFGANTGISNTTGEQNSFFGSGAGSSSVNGSLNTFFGVGAGQGNISGSENTFIGYSTGTTNTTGRYNTLLGYQANVGAAGLTNATAIGKNSVVSASNSLVLGGTGADAVQVGIGTTTPIASLDVRGSLGIIGGGTTAVASISGRTSYAALAVDNLSTVGDLFTASSSSNMQFVIKNNGFVGLATAAPTARLDVNGSASISSALTFRTGSGSIQTTALNSLNIGGNTTGNLIFNPNGNNLIGAGTSSPLASIDLRNALGVVGGGTLAVASVSGRTSFASLQVDNSLGDLFSASSSGINRFVIAQNGNVGIGTNMPNQLLALAGGNFQINATNPTIKGNLNNGSLAGAIGVYVQGKYAYVVADDRASNKKLLTVDITNPTTPAITGSLTDNANLNGVNSIAVGGRYAYMTASTSAKFLVADISNTVAPVITSSITDNVRLNKPSSVYLSGKYAYVTASGSASLNIIDISTPTSPVIIGTISNTNFLKGAQNVYVSGKYAYVTSYTGSGLAVVDVGNPYAPTIAGNITDATNLAGAYQVYVSGRYAYVTVRSTNRLVTVDVSNPNAPAITSTLTDNTNLTGATSISVAGRYAYITASIANKLTVVDISTPSTPSVVGSVTDSTNLNQPTFVYIAGKYAYVTSFSGNRLTVVDINGADLPAAHIGNLASNYVNITESADIGNNLYVRNALNIGYGGLFSQGGISVDSASGAASLIQGAPIGNALLTLNYLGSTQNIFTASTAGVTKFAIGNDGQTMVGNLAADPATAIGAGSIYYNTSSQSLKFYNGASWASIGSGSSSSGPFGILQGAIVPTNTTYDFLLGGTATSSAQFSVLGLASGTTPTASISAILGANAGNGIVLSSDGSIQSLRNNTLSIGGNTTGDIGFRPGNQAAGGSLFLTGSGNVGIGTTNPGTKLEIVDTLSSGGIFINGPVNDTANLRFRNSNQTPSDFNIDYAGGTLRFFTETGIGTGGVYIAGITNTAKVGIGTAAPTSTLEVVRPLSLGATGKALVTFYQLENQDIFTASAGAITRFTIQNDGDVGIGTGSPLAPLHISGTGPSVYIANAGESISTQLFLAPGNNNYLTGTQTGDSGFSFHATTGGFVLGKSGGTVQFKMTNSGLFGFGTYDSPTGVTPTSKLQVYALGTTPVASISGKTSGPTLLLTNDGTGDILAASVSGVQKFRINAAGDLIVGDGSGKIYGGGFDPLFTIDGKKFSTYASGINGMKEEYIGSANLTYDASAGGYAYTLDFNNFEYGSELWTFSRVIDPDLTKVNVLLTPTSQARTWFRRDPVNRKLILYSDRPTSVTFRFTAPRFDYALYPSSNHSHDIAGLQAPAAPNTTGTGEADPMDSFFASLSIQFNNGLFVVLDGFGNIVHRVDGFSNLIAANFEAGFIHAKNVAADTLSAGSASLGSATANTFAVAANTITIGGQDIRQFIIDTVTAAGFGQNTIISPLAQVETVRTNTIRPLADGGDITVKGKLVVQPDVIASDSATISLIVNGSASISGSLASGSITTDSIRINTDATVAGSLTTTNASISGTLAAGDISANQLQIRDNLKVGTVRADFGIFEQGITSMGPVTANIITATDQLAVGSNFTISNNAINTVGTDLAIQSLRQGDIAFQGGLIRMDTDGNMTVNGNFNLLGEIDAVHGVFSGTLTTPALATDLISPVADSDISLSFKNSKFNIQNSKTATGSAVLSIDNKGNIQSSGSATFAKLNFNLVGKAEATSLSEAVATGSAGFASLRAGQPELTIKNNIITSKSLIYITPFGNTDNKVLYLLRQIPDSDTEDGSFTIGISGQVPNHDLQFNWLIVN